MVLKILFILLILYYRKRIAEGEMYKKNNIHLLFTIIFTLNSLYSNSQNYSKEKRCGNYNIKYNWISFQDLNKDSDIQTIYKDSRNFIWIKKGNIIVRYDGLRYTIIDTLNLSSKYYFGEFGEDQKGNIWYRVKGEPINEIKIHEVSTGKNLNIEKYAGNNLPKINKDIVLKSFGGIIYLIENESNQIWKYKTKWLTHFQNQNPDNLDNIKTLLPSVGNLTYSINNKNILLLSNKGEKIAKYKTPENLTQLIYQNKCLYVYDQKNKEKIDTILPKKYREVIKDENYIENNNIMSFFKKIEKYEIYLFNSSEKPNHISMSLPGSKEQIDLYEESYEIFNLPLKESKIDSEMRDAIFLEDQNILYFLVEEFGLMKVEILPIHFDTKLYGLSVRSMKWINGNKLILSGMTHPEFYVYDQKRDSTYFYPNDSITGASQLDSMYFIFSKTGHSVLKISLKDGKIHKPYFKKGPVVTWEFKDKNNRIWLTSNSGIILKDSSRSYFEQINGKNLRIEHIHQHKDGKFWLSTSQGLIEWKPFAKNYKIYNTKSGLLNDNIHAVYPDSKNRLWLSTDNGISSLNLKDYSIVNYTTSDGLPDNEQNYLAHSLGPDNRIYFGGVKGLVAFNPDYIKEYENFQPKLFIAGVSSINKNGSKKQRYLLEDNFRKIFSFSSQSIQQTLTFSLPYHLNHELVLEWRISTTDSLWKPLYNDLSLPLALDYGKSVLEIKVYQKGSPNHHRIYQINLNKGTPFFMHWAFFIGIIFALAGFLWLYIQIKTVRIKKLNRYLKTEIQTKTLELNAQNQELIHQKQRLEHIDATKNQLFNNINHEFRTPLALIHMEAEIAKEKHKDMPLLKNGLENIMNKTKELTSMLDEIMDLSNFKLGAIGNLPKPIFIHTFISRIFGQFKGLAEKNKLHYQIVMTLKEDLILNIDSKKLERIIVNLLNNAFKFTPALGEIIVEASYSNNLLRIVVKDTGPGIAPEEQKRIFERYQQGSAAIQSGKKGFGIGLALSKDFALLLNGKLWVESEGSLGAKFLLEVPAEEDKLSQEIIKKASIPPLPKTKAHLLGGDKSPHILIAEDNREMLLHLKDLLSPDYRITIVNNGDEAWETLKKDTSIDLVLSDVMMPLIDGFSLLQKTRSNPITAHKSFILLTALASEENKLNGLLLGVDAYITKPFNSLQLKTQIKNLLKQQTSKKIFIEDFIKKQAENETEDHITPLDDLIGFDKEWLEKLENKVIEYLENETFKVPDMAILMGCSERSIFDKVKVLTGLTPSEYLRKARLKRAWELIKAKKYKTIKEVTYAVGLHDARSFSAAFKEEYGVSPKELLK